MRFTRGQCAGSMAVMASNKDLAMRKPSPSSVLLGFLAACTLQMAFASVAGAQTGVVAFSQSAYSVAESNTQAVINLVLTNGPSSETNIIGFATAGGTASNGVDYIAATGTVTFLPSILTNTFSITILNNPALDIDKTVNLTLRNPTGLVEIGSPSNAVLTILAQQQPVVAFSNSEYSIAETNTDAIITLIRKGLTSATGTVDFATITGGTASNGVDYTATNGTVTFLPGDISNTFRIAILGDTNVDMDETVKLVLRNPSAGLTLGNPSDAVLTILDQHTPELEFDAPSYRVMKRVGHANVTVHRLGKSSDPVSVAYATSDGTAINGTDYLGTSGLLSFAPGDTTEGFSFTVLRNSTLSNKTVNVALSSPTGAGLWTQSNAVVMIVNDLRQTITLIDYDGDLVTITLRNGGAMDVTQVVSDVNITLSETDVKSVLTVKVKKPRKPAISDGLVKIGAIQGAGGCGRIDAPSADLDGAGVILTNFLGKLRVHDILNGAVVQAGGNTNQSTTIQAHDIRGGTSTNAISVGSRLTALRAARLSDCDIDAPSIGTISIVGDKGAHIPGIITNSTIVVPVNGIIITNRTIGSIAAAQMVDSLAYAGFTPTNPANPMLGGAFVSNLVIQAVTLTATNNAFVNSYIAAAKIGSVHLRSVAANNGGQPFGILANQSMSAVLVKSPPFKWDPSGAKDQTDGDFHVILP